MATVSGDLSSSWQMVNKQPIILTPELSEEMGSSSLFSQKNPINYKAEEPFYSYFGYLPNI